jgi:damage-control phosphatase, subfamily I
MRQAYTAAALVSDDEDFRYRCLTEASRILAESERGLTPPQMGERIYGMVSRLSGNPDPFREQKEQQNSSALAQLEWLRGTVASSDDPLLMAVRLAIAGNIVDPGAQESFDLEKSVMEAVSGEAHLDAYPDLSASLDGADSVLYLADNSGEIVFDRVLVETIKDLYDVDMKLAVRGVPIINDVTEKEARDVGLDRLCRIVSSGSRMPGTFLPETTGEFREIFFSSDVVISKGQGNWETLEDTDREVFFLFQVKCPVVSRVTGCPVGRPLLWKSPNPEDRPRI